MRLGLPLTALLTALVLAALRSALPVFASPDASARAFDCGTVTDVPASECQALVALYDATSGSGWVEKSGWLSTTTACSWNGVTCFGAHVGKLDLSGHGLSGTLPAGLSALTKLSELDLFSNSLSGPLPQEIETLGYLTRLTYDATSLCEPADAAFGTWLTGLWALKRSGYVCPSGSGVAIGGPSSPFVGAALSYTALVSATAATRPLTFTWSATGQAPVVHAGLGTLTDTLALTWTVSGPKMITVTVSGGGLPLSVTRSVTPTVECPAGMAVPQAECAALAALYRSADGAGWDFREGWLQSAAACSWYGVHCLDGHVSWLSLHDNLLAGTLPAELGNLTGLGQLDLYDNRLSGAIPPELGNLTGLTRLYLSSNQLSGTIPPGLGNLTKLKTLSLDHNQLSGTIPAALGNLAVLETLSLSHNPLSGALPKELGSLLQLTTLQLDDSRLSGPLPRSLTARHLTEFSYDNTLLCEPGDATFQDWLDGISYLWRTGVICNSEYLPLARK